MRYHNGIFKSSLLLLIKAIVLTLFLHALFGCATSPNITPPQPVTEKIVYPVPDACQESYKASLWRENGRFSQLFSDQKAKGIGDIVTVRIVESSSASNKADTKTSRNSGVSGGVENFFNMEKRYPSSHPFFNPFSSINAGLDSEFDGSGATNRSGKLTASITAKVTRVLSNGNLEIVGSRYLTVNNEKQFITLTGSIRPKDISAQNVILSTYIADARINYSGAGVINDRQHPGWMGRILDRVWPF